MANSIDSFDRSDRSLSGDTADNGNNWSTTGGTAPAIVSNEAYLIDTGVNASAYLDITELNAGNNLDVRFMIKGDDATQGAVFRLWDGANPVINIGIYQENVKIFTGAWTTIVAANDGQWYDITVTNIDYGNNRCDIIVDGTTYDNGGAHFNFQTAANKIDKIQMFANNNGNCYIDTIRVSPFVTGTNTYINIGDAYKDVSKYYINIGDDWKVVNKMYINIGDTWKTVF